ncbi:uncharacterized protein C14orf119 homolog [Carassius auratus]|uniref:Uncharacterized protein C14orf119 homolog n=1 Tax=Carassius auratus TaxID=7957 RepID=A0A6P6RJA3_CARAU|nr:uncharacterized protein C14orf119 homolog [Carassius auratus]XP_026145497.1 uncharacterized protein C14orf119 homolog [Carassius auratus]XP_052386327.1 uncharacterized protein C14orf119-like [Carassius gibelio]XP_052386335.1 uncharacterized protein C14orf119-like [Carassius gibelio]
MAWFHHALQGSGQPDGSMMPSAVEDLSHSQVSKHTITQLGMSDGQGWSTLPPVSITDFPPVSGGIVPQRLDALSCTSLNVGSREDSVLLSFVTLQEQRCVISWFLGWNAVQKQRFLEDLISKAVPGKVSSLLDQLNTLQVNDRPPNIFECQLRLWTQWFESWSEEERNAFLNSLEEKDPAFVAFFYNRVAGTAGRD